MVSWAMTGTRAGWVLQVPERVAGQDPMVLAAAAIVVLVVGFSAVAVYRRVTGAPGKRFKAALGRVGEVAILMHPNPDPDAMASAIAAREIAAAAGTEATLYYAGQIRHQENRAFKTVLDLEFDRIESVAEIGQSHVVLVDHNEARGFEGARGVDPYAVVDHHPGEGTGVEFTDVRPDYGSCATIFTEYFQELGYEAAASNGEGETDGPTVSTETATGLMYGILSDTNHLTKGATPAEYPACSFLSPGIDEDRLDRIANPKVSAEVLRTKAAAVDRLEQRGSFGVCFLGELDDSDVIPQVADELMQLEGITAVVAYGSVGGSYNISGRSRDDRVHMGDTIHAVVSDIPMAGGGGHARMGGGQVSIEHMEGLGPSEGVTREEFDDRLFDAMAGER